MTFISGRFTNSTPYGVSNWREKPDALHRVCGSSSLVWRKSYSAFAHGWNGIVSYLAIGVVMVMPEPGSQTPFSCGVKPHRIARPFASRGAGFRGGAGTRGRLRRRTSGAAAAPSAASTLTLGATLLLVHAAHDVLNIAAALASLTCLTLAGLSLTTLPSWRGRATLALGHLLLVGSDADGQRLCKHENCCDYEYYSTH